MPLHSGKIKIRRGFLPAFFCMGKVMIKVFLFIWQIPQNILGFLFFCLIDCQKLDGIYIFKSDYISSFTLGGWIFLNHKVNGSDMTLRHETGHKKQSEILGFFYLPLIALPSIIGNILHRFIKFDYYGQPWERWADRLGGAQRY